MKFKGHLLCRRFMLYKKTFIRDDIHRFLVVEQVEVGSTLFAVVVITVAGNL